MPARLPEGLLRAEEPPTPPQPQMVGGMLDGQSGYVTPWAMVVDLEGYCYLRPTAAVYPDDRGSHTLWVDKVGGWYRVRVAFDERHRWKRATVNPSAHFPVDNVLWSGGRGR